MYYFCVTYTMVTKPTYTIFQRGSALSMILALVWLTVSAPMVFQYQQELKKSAGILAHESNADAGNPFSSSTEEKAPGSSSVSEEWLHDDSKMDQLNDDYDTFHLLTNMGIYVAYHGELLAPPPDAA